MDTPRFRPSLLRTLVPVLGIVLAFGIVAVTAKVLGDEMSGRMPTRTEALPGRATAIPTARTHYVFHTPLAGPFPQTSQRAMFALGCFWGAEKHFWETRGVLSTAVGYAGGFTPNPTYEESCTGRTGHAETVRVVFDPAQVRYEDLLKVFWENHDPTEGMRQGNDLGTQYRSAIFTFGDAQRRAATASRDTYQRALTAHGFGHITTELRDANASPFYFAEDYHQQYLAKNPDGYCPRHGTGISCPIGLPVSNVN